MASNGKLGNMTMYVATTGREDDRPAPAIDLAPEAIEHGVRYAISRSHGWLLNWSKWMITECT
jgi:hypothetical protein